MAKNASAMARQIKGLNTKNRDPLKKVLQKRNKTAYLKKEFRDCCVVLLSTAIIGGILFASDEIRNKLFNKSAKTPNRPAVEAVIPPPKTHIPS